MAGELASVVLIELGEDHGTVSDADARRRGASRWRWPVRLAVPVVAVMLLTSAAGSAGIVPLRPLAHLAVQPGDRVAVVGSRVIVIGVRRGHAEISSTELAGGSGWRVPFDVAGGPADIAVVAGTVIAGTHFAQAGGVHTEAFDADTGRRLWATGDELNDVGVSDVGSSGRVLLSSAAGAGGAVLREVDARTGATQSTVAVAAGCSSQHVLDPAHGVPDSLLELCFGSSTFGARTLFVPTMRVIDLATGRIRATRALRLEVDPSVLHSDGGLPQPQITVLDGLIVLTHVNVPFPMADAFRVADLRQLWSAVAVDGMDAVQRCGAGTCVTTVDGVEQIDPATGDLRRGLSPAGDGSSAPTFLLASIAGASGTTSQVIPSIPAGATADTPATAPDPRGEVWLERQDAGAAGSTSGTTLIEPLGGVGIGTCLRLSAYLACARTPNDLTFWQLPG